MRLHRIFGLIPLACVGIGAASGIRGDAMAVAAAQRLLESVGGRQAWAQRALVVEERRYLRSGEVATITVSRDLVTGARAVHRVTATATHVEWLSPGGGWMNHDGVTTAIDPARLSRELQGLRQEPYAIFARLARTDPALRVELREQGSALYVFDGDERVLCWFNLDDRGGLAGWGNFNKGRIDQHWYGPVADFGGVKLPRFGAGDDGSFEYLSVRLHDEPVAEPAPTTRWMRAGVN